MVTDTRSEFIERASFILAGLLVQLLAQSTVMVMVVVVMKMMVVGWRLRVAAATGGVRRLMLNLFGYIFADLVNPDLLFVRRRAEEEQISGRYVLVVH